MIWAAIILTVVYIVDVDTWDVVDRWGNVERVRIHGVDGWERNTEAGKEAKAWAERQLLGQRVACSQPKGYSFNRVVRACCLGGSDIAEMIVNLDHGVSDPRYDEEGRYTRPNGEYLALGCQVR